MESILMSNQFGVGLMAFLRTFYSTCAYIALIYTTPADLPIWRSGFTTPMNLVS